jgi:hypothetical protein
MRERKKQEKSGLSYSDAGSRTPILVVLKRCTGDSKRGCAVHHVRLKYAVYLRQSVSHMGTRRETQHNIHSDARSRTPAPAVSTDIAWLEARVCHPTNPIGRYIWEGVDSTHGIGKWTKRTRGVEPRWPYTTSD